MLRKWKIPIVAIVALAAVLIASSIRTRVNIRKVPGIYLTDGGMGCIIIEERPWWKLEIEEVAVIQNGEYKVSFAGSRLRLECSDTPPRQWDEVKEMLPSRVQPGDWDLVAYGLAYRLISGYSGLLGWLEQLRTTWFPLHATPAPLPRRLHYLRRINDSRVPQCFHLLELTNASSAPVAASVLPSSATLLGLLRHARQIAAERYAQAERTAAYGTARLLLKDFPDDLHVRMMYLYVAARSGEDEEVGRRLEEWRPDIKAADDPYLSRTYNVVEAWRRARRLSAAGRNAYDLCQMVLGPETDLPTRTRLFPDVLEKDAFIVPWLFGQKPEPSLRWLDIQIAVKVFRVIAIFDMVTSKREECLHLLSASFRLGQMVTQDGAAIPRSIGAACTSLAASGFEVYALNCCETEVEFRQVWETMEMLEKGMIPFRVGDVYLLESPIFRYYPEWPFDPVQIMTRLNIASTKFELVRMATAAKHRLVMQGDLPTGADQFGPLLPQGPPKDPFGDGALKFLSSTDSLTCYSIGPDKSDDRAAFAYDPTNGTISPGDIWIAVPRQRQYPFPREGVRATDIPDLLRQFPNGLPPDPFATTRGKGLGTTVTAAGDVYVFSYGPDVDEFKGLPASARVPQCHYDPTNGTVSAGDLFIRLPKP